MTTMLIYPPVDVARYHGCYPTHAPWCSNDGCGHTRHLCPRRVTEICPWWNTPWHRHTHSIAWASWSWCWYYPHCTSTRHEWGDMTWWRCWALRLPMSDIYIGPVRGAWCCDGNCTVELETNLRKVSQSWRRRTLLEPLRHYFNQPACPLWSLNQKFNFKST